MQMRYTFVRHEPTAALRGAPIVLERAFLSFYDFDNAPSGSRECVAIRGAAVVQWAGSTQVRTYTNVRAVLEASAGGGSIGPPGVSAVNEWNAADGSGASSWSNEPLYCGSEAGTGEDNPVWPARMSELERRRAIMAELISTSSLIVRHAISGCCSTGRNFLFAGLRLHTLSACRLDDCLHA